MITIKLLSSGSRKCSQLVESQAELLSRSLNYAGLRLRTARRILTFRSRGVPISVRPQRNMNRIIRLTLVFGIAAIALGSVKTARGEGHNIAELRSQFQPLPDRVDAPDNPTTPEKVALGKKLFMDTILSSGRDISCNSCHGLSTFGVDQQATSPGHKGVRGERNSPTVYNAALHFAQFWDGRAKDLEAQALGPVMNPVEMAMPSEAIVVERIAADKEYPTLFKAAFPGDPAPLSFANVGRAIAAFERTLLTPSRFDAFLKGDDHALTPTELSGLESFRNAGCVACHNGPALGGQMYQKLGIVKPFPTKDLGRFVVTENEADRFVFKVPSLRNIGMTGPYFHDGSVGSLEKAVERMGEHQLGKTFTKAETENLVAFLRSLTGETK